MGDTVLVATDWSLVAVWGLVWGYLRCCLNDQFWRLLLAFGFQLDVAKLQPFVLKPNEPAVFIGGRFTLFLNHFCFHDNGLYVLNRTGLLLFTLRIGLLLRMSLRFVHNTVSGTLVFLFFRELKRLRQIQTISLRKLSLLALFFAALLANTIIVWLQLGVHLDFLEVLLRNRWIWTCLLR